MTLDHFPVAVPDSILVEDAAVGAEGQGTDDALSRQGRAGRLARRNVPQPHLPVRLARRERVSVGAESDLDDGLTGMLDGQSDGPRQATSHNCTEFLSLMARGVAVARRCPSGLKATDTTCAMCGKGVWAGLTADTSQSRVPFRSLSRLLVASVRPSGLKATARTVLPCGKGGPMGTPLATSHNSPSHRSCWMSRRCGRRG